MKTTRVCVHCTIQHTLSKSVVCNDTQFVSTPSRGTRAWKNRFWRWSLKGKREFVQLLSCEMQLKRKDMHKKCDVMHVTSEGFSACQMRLKFRILLNFKLCQKGEFSPRLSFTAVKETRISWHEEREPSHPYYSYHASSQPVSPLYRARKVMSSRLFLPLSSCFPSLLQWLRVFSHSRCWYTRQPVERKKTDLAL